MASYVVLGRGPAQLSEAAVLQTLLMASDGPEFRLITAHGEGRGEKKAVSYVPAVLGSFRSPVLGNH